MIGRTVDHVQVVTRPTLQREGPGTGGEHIVLCRSDDFLDIGEGIALGIAALPAACAERGQGDVDGLCRGRIIDRVDTPGNAAIKDVGFDAADEGVGVFAAHNDLDARERIARSETGVNAGFQIDGHASGEAVLVAGRVDAGATDQLVGPRPADQQVVACTAGNDVVAGAAATGEVTGAGVGQALDFVAHGQAGQVGANLVVTASRQFDNPARTRTIDDVDVVTGPPVKGGAAGGHGEHVSLGRAVESFYVAEGIPLRIATAAGAG